MLLLLLLLLAIGLPLLLLLPVFLHHPQGLHLVVSQGDPQPLVAAGLPSCHFAAFGPGSASALHVCFM